MCYVFHFLHDILNILGLVPECDKIVSMPTPFQPKLENIIVYSLAQEKNSQARRMLDYIKSVKLEYTVPFRYSIFVDCAVGWIPSC